MLDKDLASLYGVRTGNLNLAVRRNKDRFPGDFMFQISKKEFESLILQNAISKSKIQGRGGTRKLPYAFTEQGVSMFSGVLNSEIAVQVHIQIIRVFAKMKEILLAHKDILLRLEKIETKITGHDQENIEQGTRNVEQGTCTLKAGRSFTSSFNILSCRWAPQAW